MDWSFKACGPAVLALCAAGSVVCGCKSDEAKASANNKETLPRAVVAAVKRGPVEKSLTVAGEFVPF